MPDPVSVQAESNLELWQGAWIAALATGVVVWGLIAWVVIRFRRRSDDEIPVQTRYNLPLEIFYTIFPVIMVIVFFSHTVRVQNIMLDDSPPDNEITVVGQQWQWAIFRALKGSRKCPVNIDLVTFLAGIMRSIANGESKKNEDQSTPLSQIVPLEREGETSVFEDHSFSVEDMVINKENAKVVHDSIISLFGKGTLDYDVAEGIMAEIPGRFV